MNKGKDYVEFQAAGMNYRLIPVTEEIIRCVISKREISGENNSLIIEKKEYPAVDFQAEESGERVILRTAKVVVEISR